MTLVSVSSFVAFPLRAVATPRPVSQGSRSWLDLMEANATAWEFTLLASVALNVVLCKVSWGVYRALRLTGLYPPGMEPVGLGRIRTVSPWEVFCEAEDLECFGVCDQTDPSVCDSGGHLRGCPLGRGVKQRRSALTSLQTVSFECAWRSWLLLYVLLCVLLDELCCWIIILLE
ncbi:unnamed protein product [Prorocentrum cordatum]|uniref:Uncharacterized protein n=1 Tax=Prorocentrum cordatum TaxID=2364126 RepID=A0ABN9XQL6_9DINO|nr:unnamed protein product [Polarella glacialis]